MTQTVRLIVFYHDGDETEYHSVGRNISEVYMVVDLGSNKILASIGRFISPIADKIPARCYCTREALERALCDGVQPNKVKSYATDIDLINVGHLSSFKKIIR